MFLYYGPCLSLLVMASMMMINAGEVVPVRLPEGIVRQELNGFFLSPLKKSIVATQAVTVSRRIDLSLCLGLTRGEADIKRDSLTTVGSVLGPFIGTGMRLKECSRKPVH